MLYWSSRTPPASPILFKPPTPPYEHYVAGEGIIETINEDVNVGVPFPDLVTDIYIDVDQPVAKGTPLFQLDRRQLWADLRVAEADLALAITQAENQTVQFEFYEQLKNKAAVSEQEYSRALFAKKEAEQTVCLAQAKVQQIETRLERSTICAPMDGRILQKNINVGEFANINPFHVPSYITFGNGSLKQIRVQIAEEDAWRVYPGAAATAYVRGNADIAIPLTFRYIEPLIIPKQSLTGSDFERVDTRVLEIVYYINIDDLPVYTGQLMNVYVEAAPYRYNT